jgi:hypothetical protein
MWELNFASPRLEAKTSRRTRLLYVIYFILVGVASRVSAERCEPVGGLVGYSIRLEAKTSSRTRLLFCTTGILLKVVREQFQRCGSDFIPVRIQGFYDQTEEKKYSRKFF